MDKRIFLKMWALYSRPYGTLEWRRSVVTDKPEEVNYWVQQQDDMYEFMSVMLTGDYPASWDEIEERT